MNNRTPSMDDAFRDPRDPRTIPFVSAEFGNVWAVHRGAIFETRDVTPFQREWKEWLAAHDKQVRAEAWDEGYETGTVDGRYTEITFNPYREECQQS